MSDSSSNNATGENVGENGAAAGASDRINISPWRLIRRYWRINVTSSVDQDACIEDIRQESYVSGRYVLMTMMSAGIAILGMLLSSPAVVIGAMLLSPLMGPIMGLGMSLAVGDFTWVRRTARALALGTILAILFCAFIVMVSPLQTVTAEIAARTRPNLFDLAVALFSAIAGAYAMIRGRGGAIVGVAIATALMPPLAAVGFGLATGNWTVFGGALLLFITNLITIALTMAVMARLYGFRTQLSDRQTLAQNVVIAVSFVVLAIPLGFSLQQIAWESNSSRVTNGFISDLFGESARISAIDIDFGIDPIAVNATVLTPTFIADAEARSSRALTRQLGRPVAVTIAQYRVGRGAANADAAQLAAARAKEQALTAERKVTQLAERLSLIAGAPAEDILIDTKRKRAMVKASVLPGASISAYRMLEERVANLDPEWDLRVEPPALRLPNVSIVDGKPDDSGKETLADIIWAAQRVDTPLGLNGPSDAVDAIMEELGRADVKAVRTVSLPTRPNAVSFDWLAPDAAD